MTTVISVRFRNGTKTYYFDPRDLTVAPGDDVIVETAQGLEFAQCTEGNHQVADDAVIQPLRPVVRLATANDKNTDAYNRTREKEAFDICQKKIAAHKLEMKLVRVECSFDGSKIIFFFTADGRVDFRELVKDLAGVFRSRIELRQIGVRDEAKMLGGLGICGRPFCCAQFMDDFVPVSIKMAKTQNLSLNPTKISGTCGRLMCCLKYEQEAYEHLIKTLPKAEASVDTPKGKGTVTEVNLLRRTVKVRLADSADNSVQTYPVDRLGYTLNGEYIEPKPAESAPAVSDLPDLSLYAGDQPGRLGNRLAEALMEPKPAEKKEGRSRSRRKNRGGERKDRPQEAGAPAGEKKKPAEGEKKFEKKQESRPRPPKNQNRPQNAGPKAQAAAEKAEGGEKKHGNYHRRYFHRGNKKPGGAPKSEG
jgi:cell fate regulator YaaT (PSP1 superfamily)